MRRVDQKEIAKTIQEAYEHYSDSDMSKDDITRKIIWAVWEEFRYEINEDDIYYLTMEVWSWKPMWKKLLEVF